jgi:hypothetical protein
VTDGEGCEATLAISLEIPVDKAQGRRRGSVSSLLTLVPGQRLEVEVVQPDGGRALVAGVLDSVPDTTHGRALRIRVCEAQVRPLPPTG